MIKLDGSYLEGGGQIVRNALALSALTGKAFEVINIRKGRADAGLKAQHLNCVKAAAQLSDAIIEGASIGSTSFSFTPRKLEAKDIDIDIGTAGSTTLLLQSILIPSMFSDSKIKLRIKGGTDVNWSMPVDYFKEVFLPQLFKYARIHFKLKKRGYFPAGGGEIELLVIPEFRVIDFNSFDDFHRFLKTQKKINLIEQGNLIQIKGISHASRQLEKSKVAERQAEAARLALRRYSCPIQIVSEYTDTLSAGSGITLWAIFSLQEDEISALNPIRLGADALGEKGISAEDIGRTAANKLIEEVESGAAVDQHLADNLIPFLGLFGGRIRVSRITNHTLTNIYVTEKFLDAKFDVDKKLNIISCE